MQSCDSCNCVPGICVSYLPKDSLLAHRKYSSTRRPGGTAFEIQLPVCKCWAKCRDKETVLSVHPCMNQETHGDEYFHGLLLQHLPWRDECQLLHHGTQLSKHCMSCLIEHKRLGNIRTDEHFAGYDLEEAVRRVRTLHDLRFHNADGQHDNNDGSDDEIRDPHCNALNLSMQCEQSLGAYMAGEASDAAAIAQNHNTAVWTAH